jgi:hypothetical protein
VEVCLFGGCIYSLDSLVGVIHTLVFRYVIIPAYRKHQHTDYTYDIVQAVHVYAATNKQLPCVVIITFDSSQRVMHCILSFNNDHM